MTPAEYIPALKYHFLTPVYDVFIRLTMPETAVKTRAIALAGVQPRQQIVDFGCGTGTLLAIGAAKHPSADWLGLDVDETIMAVARKKLVAVPNCRLLMMNENRFPIPADSSDALISTWVFHHLYDDVKCTALREIYRVLKPGGRLVIADWGKARNWLMRGLFFGVQLLDYFTTTQTNVSGKLPEFMREAGFANVREADFQNTLFGTLRYYVAEKPPDVSV